MAEPRATTTQRAVLSYSQLKSMVDKWPALLIKDYQGIGQDSKFIADEIDALEILVLDNRVDIDLNRFDIDANRADIDINSDDITGLKARIFTTKKVVASVEAKAFEVILCDNAAAIIVTLDTNAVKDDMIHVMRRNEEVTTVGLINGLNDRLINVKYWSELYIFDGIEWSVI
tara:strand:+ start:21074 stop:21592 length:519 start_codon:yes stop_codon:yes gene_type:complete